MKRISRTLIFFQIVFSLLLPSVCFAQKATAKGKATTAANKSSGAVEQTPNILGAKAFLEELLSNRIGLDLATLVSRDDFTIGSQLDLVEITPKAAPASVTTDDSDPQTLPADLLLGTLDPEALLKKFGDPEAAAKMGTFLSQFKITKVAISVGLKENLPKDLKEQVEKRLSERLTREFGSIGQGNVNYVLSTKKVFIDQLNRFQGLAGNAAIAFAIIVGAFFWMLGNGKSKSSGAQEASTASASPQSSASGSSGMTNTVHTTNDADPALDAANQNSKISESEQLQAEKEITRITNQLQTLGSSISADREAVIRSWCEAGEEGKLKLACFADVSGKGVGKLPIPADSIQEMSEIFAKMPLLPITEKATLLKKVYWDLIAAFNLGSKVLAKPFGYVANFNSKMVNQALLEQNPKMKTFVSLHMPQKLRESYFKSIGEDVKQSLLEEASQLGEVPLEEFNAMNADFKVQLSGGERLDSIVFDSALGKLAESLSSVEQIVLLRKITGAGLETYKFNTPALAFLEDWNDETLSILLQSVPSDELATYLRIRPDVVERFIALCPPMTAELVRDELSRADKLSENDRHKFLQAFKERLQEYVSTSGIALTAILTFSGTGNHEANDETRKAA